ncbi:hypothetical protein M8J76_006262 [Diaphorina citri]|nr:hypothetical protein M8J76_006262 [Diaphorina citri]
MVQDLYISVHVWTDIRPILSTIWCMNIKLDTAIFTPKQQNKPIGPVAYADDMFQVSERSAEGQEGHWKVKKVIGRSRRLSKGDHD